MNRLVVVLLALATGCASVAPGLHQSESAARGAHPRMELIPITPAVLRAQAEARAGAAAARAHDPDTIPDAAWEYRVAPHDVLSVIVWDHPELTIPAGEYRAPEFSGNTVQADGTMFYPHIGVFPVAGRTLPEIRSVITERLRKVIESPQLDVRVAAFRGQRVEVTGEVLQPSTIPITDIPLHVQDAIAAAKGLTPNAWTRGVTLTRAGKVYRLDLEALYQDGDVSQNWLLRDGDLLNVPSREQNKVFVLGEVKRPSSKLMAHGHMTLAEAIGDSEGFDQTTSNPAEVYVIRGRYEAAKVYKLDASSADALLLAVQFQLEPLDVVFVSQYPLTNWNRMVQQLLPTIQGVWQMVDIGNRTVNALGGTQ